MGKYVYLSHPLSLDTPNYGGGNDVRISSVRTIATGDSCNMQRWDISNHAGTHIDAPRHFYDGGETLDAYPPEFWLCNSVGILHLPLTPARWITPEDITGIPTGIEGLLIKTGFQSRRKEAAYAIDNPGLSAELALSLRERFPALKFVGMDFISISRFTDRLGGRAAHKAFLDPARPILPIEDMDLSPLRLDTTIQRLWVVPVRVAGADGAPVTVFAELA